ncbi:8-oxo-dGTP diphosphatase MutT [Pseudaeromonas sp. ZJS20]|uniref:8-oxo-dGTP diphosphatase MutT n=1 Tax=Pseudaeromonas aegiceratis TaxID=3153928 RepID=UPI00390CA903
MSQHKVIWVAVGVIRDAAGRFCICQRHARQHQGGKWEFPGGKVEAGESLPQALARELKEEIGIEVAACEPLLAISHDYGDKQVLLDVWLVSRFSGQAQGLEGQPLRWVSASELADYAFPEANQAIVAHLQGLARQD